MQRRIIPGVIDGQQALCCLAPDATVRNAADLMAEWRIGAVLVMEQGALAGIVTERDMVFRVLAKGLDAEKAPLREVMTTKVDTVTPQDSAMRALDMMQTGHYRHLPVLDGNDVCGIVSIRDLYEAIRVTLQEELQSAESLIYGDQYGSGPQT
ncbi:MAG: CBS domain-containing protein [Geminicoccaceae bacterium]|nr:CBS domain-containing protein [Geminicoccaceae bacterium]